MKVWIDERTGRVVVEDTEDRDDWETEPNPIIFHPVCRADELAWWLNVPGQLVGKRYGHK